MRRLWTATRDVSRKALTSWHAFVLLAGTAAGSMILAWCFQWTAWFGTSLPVTTAVALSVLLGLELGWRSLKVDSPEAPPKWPAIGCLGFALVWTAGFPWFVEWQSQFLGLFPPIRLIQPAFALAVLFGMALTIFTPAFYALARLPLYIGVRQKSSSPTALASLYLVGIALGILFSAFLLVPYFGLTNTAVAFSAAALIAGIVKFSKDHVNDSAQADETFAEEPASPGGFWDKQGREIWTGLIVICLGGVFAWTSRAVDQLIPTAVTLTSAKWSCLILGWAAGVFWGTRSAKSRNTSPGSIAGAFLGAWLVLIAAAFPLLVDLSLNVTVSVSNVFLITLCRLGLVSAIVAPLGFCWGIFSAGAYDSEASKSKHVSPAVPLLAAAFLAGWLLCRWVLLPNSSMPGLAVGLAVCVFILAATRLFFEKTKTNRWANRAAIAGLALLLAASFVWSGNYRPETSARLLFAGPVFSALQDGLDRDLLTVIDEGRHLATAEGRQGTYTLWKYRGVQFQLRENGLPKGMASGDARLCPDFSAEVLPTAFPLVLHERPETMLILGLGSGVSVTTSLAFPTQEVTCVEGDPALIELVKNQIWSEHRSHPNGDARFTMLPLDPAIWVRSKTGTFDVIVSLPPQATLAESSAFFTRSFYEKASEKLTEDGLFCQRFGFIDFGPDALRVTARTMQSAFRDVVFLEMAGGEMLLIGTNSEKGVAREGLLARFQKEHVRRQLAELGWDWSIPLNLAAFHHESLKEFSAKDSSWSDDANTAANGTLAFRLPAEMMRWGVKPLENHQALAEHAGRFAEWGGIDSSDPDLLRRLAEVTGQRKLMTNRPDEYWVYRKTVKDQITKRPRSIIVQVKGEMPKREMHPGEKRRMGYFRALADTFKHHPHRADDIARVESFAEPYDPLVTYFLHQEVAELHSRAEPRNYAAELNHRIHAAYFAAPGDRSVRSLAEALGILANRPEAMPSATERWDHLDALLQVLKQRWAVRAGVAPTSTDVTLNDVDKSLSAVSLALRAMDDLREEAGIDADDWQARKRFLETTVIHPLRAYRGQLMPFQERERLLKQKLKQKTDPELESSPTGPIPVGI